MESHAQEENIGESLPVLFHDETLLAGGGLELKFSFENKVPDLDGHESGLVLERTLAHGILDILFEDLNKNIVVLVHVSVIKPCNFD